ncbi:MAG: hypothetical protein JW983_06330 [Elusimicrobia bacterium]|nr:hypothetical protein [Elusimicrobiota bacterium]
MNQKGFGFLELLITAILLIILSCYIARIQKSNKNKPEDSDEKIIDATEKMAQEVDKRIEYKENIIEKMEGCDE